MKTNQGNQDGINEKRRYIESRTELINRYKQRLAKMVLTLEKNEL